jgi:hypothetical protein
VRDLPAGFSLPGYAAGRLKHPRTYEKKLARGVAATWREASEPFVFSSLVDARCRLACSQALGSVAIADLEI